MSSRICSSVPVVLALLASAWAGGPVPYGHRDFYPSPERPVGFRGDGNGYFPGATPVTVWWEGTPERVKVTVREKRGRTEKQELWDYADRKSHNIVWKTPLPGWSMAPPIVVGDCVFCVGEPHWLVCLDARSGKLLWKREVLALQFSNTMPAAHARKVHEAMEIGRLTNILRGGHGPGTLARTDAKGDALRAALPELMDKRWRPVIEAADPGLIPAFEKDLALARKFAKVAGDEARKLKRKKFTALERAIEKKYEVHISRAWIGYFGSALATPVSDGERVFVQFYSGAVAAYDLDGHLLWGKHFKGGGNKYSCFEPLSIHGDVLVARDCQRYEAVGLDTRTGRELWRLDFEHTDTGGASAASQYCHDLTVHVPLADGSILRALVLQSSGRVIDPRDGTVVATFDHKVGRGYVLSGHGDVFQVCSQWDNGGSPYRVYRLAGGSREQLKVETVCEYGRRDRPTAWHGAHRAASEEYVFTAGGHRGSKGIFDATTGERVARWPLPRGRRLSAPVVAGSYVIGADWHSPGNYPYGRRRKDRKALTPFAMIDVSDPARPQYVERPRLLGDASPPADGAVAKYLPGFDPFLLAGNYKGTPSWFGCALGGVVPNANRIFIQSASNMYCVGDPGVEYDWNPASRPQTVAEKLKQ